jgi:hypothetical protein
MFKRYLQPVVVFRSGARVKLMPCENVKWECADKGLKKLTLENIPNVPYGQGHAAIGSIEVSEVVAIELHSCYRLMTVMDIINLFTKALK